MRRVAIYKAMQHVTQQQGCPCRRESVRSQEVRGKEILTLVYSYRDRELGRVYRVAVFTPERCIYSAPIS